MQAAPAKTSILVLDIDGTLTNSVALHQEAFLGAIQALGLRQLETNWGSYAQHTDTGIVAEAIARDPLLKGIDFNQTAFEADLEQRFSILLQTRGISEIAGAKAFVEAAHLSDWGVVFASGGIRSVSREKLRAVGIPYSDEILITSSEWENRTQLVAAAIARAQSYYGIASPQSVLSLGDGRWDWQVARQLDIHFLGVGRAPSADVLRSLGAKVIGDLRDAAAMLNRFDHQSN